MNPVRSTAAIFHLILLCYLLFAYAGIHESDDTALAHGQLTIKAEEQLPLRPNPSHGISQDGSASQSALFDPLEQLRDALEVMQRTWFRVWVGTWPTAIDWTRAVIDTYLVSSLTTLSKALDPGKGQHAHDSNNAELRQIENEINQYFSQNVAYYFGEDAFSLRNQAYDDMLWVVLGWLESIKFIKTHCQLHRRSYSEETTNGNRSELWHGHQFIGAFAHRARIFYDVTTRGWDTELCGGGMTWSPYLGPYKNAITNELFITASVGMYLYFPGDDNSSPFMVDKTESLDLDEPAVAHDESYLKNAVDGYDWLKNSNMTNAKGLYTDGFHVSNWKKNGTKCDRRNNMVYTYNQGVLLSGLRGLWEGTGDRVYLEDGHQLVKNVIEATGWDLESDLPSGTHEWAGIGRNGLLEERCDASGRCDQNGQTFKGIFFHHLTLFCEPLPLKPVVPGKTHCADKDTAFLHRQSCLRYTAWTAHNARAALDTRNEKGRFGMWWGARSGVSEQPSPEGAIDYRNNASELFDPLWRQSDDVRWSYMVDQHENGEILDAFGRVRAATGKRESDESLEARQDHGRTRSDLNDRGRGRTVETQGGGVAVLRALWELLNMV